MGYNVPRMSETEAYRHPFELQERLEWYHLNALLQSIGQAATEMDLHPEDMVHIGGTANFYRCYQAFGPRAVMLFRGTHDMDIISFNQGKVQQVLDRVRAMPDSPIVGYTIGKAVGLPDKKSAYVQLATTNNPGISTGFEMDIYESRTGRIKFNNRLVTKDKIILDPPEELSLPKHRGMVAVPSIRDNFLIKMDIVDFSRSGLRPKDQFDILVTLKLCSALKCNFTDLLDALAQTSDQYSLKEKLLTLEKLLSNPKEALGVLPGDYPFLPSVEEINSSLHLVRQRLKG